MFFVNINTLNINQLVFFTKSLQISLMPEHSIAIHLFAIELKHDLFNLIIFF